MEFFERVKRSGLPVPQLDERPKLTGWESEVWLAFAVINRTRRSGFAGPEPLDIASTRAWLESHGWSGDRLTEAMDLIFMLDMRLLEWGASDGPGSEPSHSDRGQPGQAGGG